MGESRRSPPLPNAAVERLDDVVFDDVASVRTALLPGGLRSTASVGPVGGRLPLGHWRASGRQQDPRTFLGMQHPWRRSGCEGWLTTTLRLPEEAHCAQKASDDHCGKKAHSDRRSWDIGPPESPADAAHIRALMLEARLPDGRPRFSPGEVSNSRSRPGPTCSKGGVLVAPPQSCATRAVGAGGRARFRTLLWGTRRRSSGSRVAEGRSGLPTPTS